MGNLNITIKKELRTKIFYIVSLIFMFFMSFLFISFGKALDTDTESVIIPRIDGVSFYTVDNKDETILSKIDTSLSNRIISFPKNETLHIKVQIEDDKYYSGKHSGELDAVKSCFTVSGNLTMEELLFEEQTNLWSLEIAHLDKNSQDSALNVKLTQRRDVILDFPDIKEIKYKEVGTGNVLGGNIKTVKSGLDYTFEVVVDTSMVFLDGDDFKILAGDNAVDIALLSVDGNSKTYKAKINAIYNCRIEPNETVSITFSDIQGISYTDVWGNTITSGSSKMLRVGSEFTFKLDIDSRVPISRKTLEFIVGNNQVTATRDFINLHYIVTLPDVRFSGRIESNGLLSITFPSIQDVTFSDEFGDVTANSSRTVMLNSMPFFTFTIAGDSPLKGKTLQFSAGGNKDIRTSSSTILFGKPVTESADIALNYHIITYSKLEGLSFLNSDNNASLNGTKVAVESGDEINFYVQWDQTLVSIGDNIQNIVVSVGDNKNVSTSKVITGKFSVKVTGIFHDATVTVPALKTLKFLEIDGVNFYQPDSYGNANMSATIASGPKQIVQGSKYQFVVQLPQGNIEGNEGKVNFSFGQGNQVVVKKYYIESSSVFYSIEVTVNEDGTFETQNAYTISFPKAADNILFFDGYKDITDKQVFVGYKYNFTIQVNNSPGYFADPTILPKVSVGNASVVVHKTSNSTNKISYTVTVTGLNSNATVDIEKVNISLPVIDGLSFTSPTSPSSITGKILPVMYGGTVTIMSKAESSKFPDINLNFIKFSAGNNKISTLGNAGSFTLQITAKENATVSMGKLVTFPSIYGVKFYPDDKQNNIENNNLGEEIEGGMSQSVQTGKKFSFIAAVPSSIGVTGGVTGKVFQMFSLGKYIRMDGTRINTLNGYDYFRVSANDALTEHSPITSSCLFTVDMPTLPDVHYYKNNTNEKFEDEIIDKKITIFSKNLSTASPYKFYVHFNNILLYPLNSLPKITASGNITAKSTPKSDYASVEISAISANSSINIAAKKPEDVYINMPEKHSYINLLQYTKDNGQNYDDTGGNRIAVSYGTPMSIRLSFKGGLAGYSNLYRTLYKNIKVKVYSTSSLGNEGDISQEGRLLKTLDIKSLSADSGKFVQPLQVYESDKFYPTEDSILMIEGIERDFYDIDMISGDNSFMVNGESKDNIEEVIKVFKIDPSSKNETEVPYIKYKESYVIRGVSYGDSIKFKYKFTDGATDKGVKYNMSKLITTQFPYEGDTDIIDNDPDGVYKATIKSNTIFSISGIDINMYTINILNPSSVDFKYVLDSDAPTSDIGWITADKKISASHGQKLVVKISSNDPVKRYIKTVALTDTTHGNDPVEIYSGEGGLAKQMEAITRIEGVLFDADIAIVISKREYRLNFVVLDSNENDEEITTYPDPSKMIIYNNSDMAINNLHNGPSEGAPEVVKEGDNFDFKITLDYKYDRSNLIVSRRTYEEGDSNSGIVITPNDKVYTLKNVRKDSQIMIDDLEINQYDVEFPQPSDEVNFHKVTFENGAEIEDIFSINGIQKIKHGDSLNFVPKVKSGYELSGESVKSNGNPMSLINGKYTLPDIANDIKITVEPLNKAEYDISFPADIPGVTFMDSLGSSISLVKKEYKSSFDFKILIDPTYGQSEDSMIVYATPQGTDWSTFDPANPGPESIRLKKDNAGNYTLKDIYRNTVIIPTDVKINEYFVDLPISDNRVMFSVPQKGEYVEVTEENKYSLSVANHGENFVFSAKAKEGYDISVIKITAIATGETYENEIEKMGNGYIIQNVTNDVTVRASQINIQTHKVGLKGDNMIFRKNINSSEEISSMIIDDKVGVVDFTVSPRPGYVFSDTGLSVSVEPYQSADVEIPNLNADKTLNGPIKVKNVDKNVELNFSGIEVKTSVITLPTDTEGISFMKVDNENSDNPQMNFEWENKNIVPVGSDFKFHIKADHGYSLESIYVSTGPGNHLYPTNGIYTLENVSTDVKIEVSGVEYSIYTFKLRGENMGFYEPNGLFPKNDFQILYKGETQFRIVADTGYGIDMENGVSFDVNGKKITPGDTSNEGTRISSPDSRGVFTVSRVEEDIVINVSGAEKNVYYVSFPTNIVGAKIKTPDGKLMQNTEKIDYLGSVRFEIIPDEGYNKDSAIVRIDPNKNGVVRELNGGYIIESVSGNIAVSVEGINPNDYSVRYKGIGADFYKTDGTQITSSTTKFGESFTFSIKAQAGYNLTRGYDLSILSISGDRATISFSSGDKSAKLPDGTAINETDKYTYTVSDVKGPMVVLIESVGKNEYNVSFPTSIKGVRFLNLDGQQITQGKTLHNSDFSFRIVAEEGYDISNINVRTNLGTIELIDGKYTIEDIISDISIEISGVVSTKVYINLKYVSGIIFKDKNDVEISTLNKIWVDNGSNFSFKVSLDDSYSHSSDTIKVSLDPDNSIISFDRGIYTISNITENVEVSVSGVQLNTYKINLSESNGIKYMDEYGINQISGPQTINYGKDFRFMLNPAEGFTLADIEVSVKGGDKKRVQLNPVDGVYTIPEVTSDYTVVVENAKKEIYTVEIRISEGVSLLDKGGNSLQNRQSVKHGDNLSFKLSLDTAYDKSSPMVKVKGNLQPITPENNFYTVLNVTGDTIVEVTNVKKNTYTVTFREAEGVIYRTDKNKPFEGSLQVEYGGTLTFKVALKDPYDASQFTVLLDGDKPLGANGGIYQILSVGSDCEVSVKYVTKNTEEYVIEMINGLPTSVSNREDASKVVSVTRSYNELPDENKKLVTNISKLRILQTGTTNIHHESNGVEVTGIDWNIKVNVVPLDGDAKSVERLNDKMERKTVIAHYEISLVDSLTGKKYGVPEEQEVSVVVPFDAPNGYMNMVIVHEKESGSIEYLDVLVNNGYAKFSTSSFSVFGIAAKKIPNYVEDVTDVTVSLAGLTRDEEETKKQILGQEIPSILENETGGDPKPGGSTSNSSGNNIKDLSGENFANKALSWILNNEFMVTVFIIAIFSVWIFIIIYKNNKQKHI